MERIWWGDDKHGSSNRHCRALFHFIKQETDGFGKALFCDISKNLKISGTDNSTLFQWESLFICSFVYLFVLLRPCHASLEILVKLRKNHKTPINTNASKCAQWHAPFLKQVSCRTWLKPMSNCKLKLKFGVPPPMNYAGYREVSLLLSIL